MWLVHPETYRKRAGHLGEQTRVSLEKGSTALHFIHKEGQYKKTLVQYKKVNVDDLLCPLLISLRLAFEANTFSSFIQVGLNVQRRLGKKISLE